MRHEGMLGNVQKDSLEQFKILKKLIKAIIIRNNNNYNKKGEIYNSFKNCYKI